jgi:glutamate/tyrosine decarboxylase-like PLP-dependent enzyme
MSLYKDLIDKKNKNLQLKLMEMKANVYKELLPDDSSPRFDGGDRNNCNLCIDKDLTITDEGMDPLRVFKEIISELCRDAPNWNSQNLHYNVGAPINNAAAMSYSFALENNIFTINSGLAGNTLLAEKAVVKILSKLANISNKTTGWFTFGGTGINLYGLKTGIKKAAPKSSEEGIPRNMKIITTSNAHFGHAVCAEWMGIGTNNIVVIKENNDGTTNINDFEHKLQQELEKKSLIGCIYLNGGTSYSHVIDDIKKLTKIRDSLGTKYGLEYKPHIHIDTVIGWFWLFFNGYDWEENPLEIHSDVLLKIKRQYKRISQIKYADSWGSDFHKGIGGCPVDCSVFILNNKKDSKLLSKKENKSMQLHQIAEEFSHDSPVNYTLENSRSAGPMLSALTSLMTMGKNGYREYLANLISASVQLKKFLKKNPRLFSCDMYDQGFVVMIRLYPETFPLDKIGQDVYEGYGAFVHVINKYNKEFFDWEYHNRLKKPSSGIEYSYSTNFISRNNVGIHALKIYLMSPFLSVSDIEKLVDSIIEMKKKFDKLPATLATY